MPLEIKKQDRENSQNLVRRFSKRVKMSGLLRLARKNRFHERVKSKPMKKKSALKRAELRKEYEYTKKMGKTDE